MAPLINQIKEEGLSDRQCQKVRAFLEEYGDIFSKHEYDIGCFKGVYHTIDTEEAKPVKQGIHKTPVNFQD